MLFLNFSKSHLDSYSRQKNNCQDSAVHLCGIIFRADRDEKVGAYLYSSSHGPNDQILFFYSYLHSFSCAASYTDQINVIVARCFYFAFNQKTFHGVDIVILLSI